MNDELVNELIFFLDKEATHVEPEDECRACRLLKKLKELKE